VSEIYVIIDVYCYSCNIPLFLTDFSETWISSTGFQKMLKHHISWKSV